MIRNVLGLIPRRFKTFTARRSSANALVSTGITFNQHPIVITSIHERITIREFCWRIGHFFDTCKNRAAFASDELWRMRARACVEAMASLVFNADAEVGWFGDTLQVLGDIGSFEGIHNLSLAGKDEAFVVRWTCLSIMAIRSALNSRRWLNYEANEWNSVLNEHFWSTEAQKKAREIDETLEHRWGTEHECHLSSKISFAADTMQELKVSFVVRTRLTRPCPDWVLWLGRAPITSVSLCISRTGLKETVGIDGITTETQKPGQYSQLGREAKEHVMLLPLEKEKKTLVKSTVVNHNLMIFSSSTLSLSLALLPTMKEGVAFFLISPGDSQDPRQGSLPAPCNPPVILLR